MGNIIDYVREYGRYDFKERPLCTEDILVLAQLSYLKFEGLVPTVAQRALAAAVSWMDQNMEPDVVFMDQRFRDNNRLLWQALAESKRFSSMQCNYYRSRLDEDKCMQFAAVTFFPQDSCPVVVFRGTDENFVGWREDFYLAFAEPIPAQKESAVYLQQICCLTQEPFVVCGHSKGGNLAVYASMLAEPSVQKRIKQVYSFDGPGFRPEFLQGASYENIRSRVHRILPASSLVGMLLQNYEAYEVIASDAFSVWQHDCYTWRITEGSLVRLADIENKQRRINEVLNRFIFSMEEEELRVFVDTLFGIIEKTGAVTLTEFAADWKKNLKICLKQIRTLDKETGEKIRQIFRLLLEITADVRLFGA
ncbi:MAG: DUF2974 domain-containing protein [Lachnospiraceae bacterium]|nr:DUF2974 domain-containing protein [Lachnospiraceae bacterium]